MAAGRVSYQQELASGVRPSLPETREGMPQKSRLGCILRPAWATLALGLGECGLLVTSCRQTCRKTGEKWGLCFGGNRSFQLGRPRRKGREGPERSESRLAVLPSEVPASHGMPSVHLLHPPPGACLLLRGGPRTAPCCLLKGRKSPVSVEFQIEMGLLF